MKYRDGILYYAVRYVKTVRTKTGKLMWFGSFLDVEGGFLIRYIFQTRQRNILLTALAVILFTARLSRNMVTPV